MRIEDDKCYCCKDSGYKPKGSFCTCDIGKIKRNELDIELYTQAQIMLEAQKYKPEFIPQQLKAKRKEYENRTLKFLRERPAHESVNSFSQMTARPDFRGQYRCSYCRGTGKLGPIILHQLLRQWLFLK